MVRGIPITIALTVIVCLGVVDAFAQVRPQVLICPGGGAVNTIKALAFSTDSTRLFVAGHDKFVQVWELRQVGNAAHRYDAVPAGFLRWELSRGLRGAIFCIASARTSSLLAAGGYGGRSPGSIVLFDTTTAQISKVLLGSPGPGHKDSLASLAFSPNGRSLASLSVDGELRVWNATRNWASRQLQNPFPGAFPTQCVRFLNDSLLVSAYWVQGAWRLARYTTDGAAPQILAQLHDQGVTALALDSATQKWASADGAGNVFLWDDPVAQQPRLLRKGSIATSLAFGPGGTLFVATQSETSRKVSSRLEMWDAALSNPAIPSGPRDFAISALFEHNNACAVSPNNKWIATCSGDHNDVSIFSLVDAQGKSLEKPLSNGRPVVLRGAGNKLGKVAFAADGSERLGFGVLGSQPDNEPNENGLITRTFDLRKHILQPVSAEARWRRWNDGSELWDASVDRNNPHQILVRHDGTVQGRISLDPRYQGAARCFCWLRFPTASQPWGLAVGTGEQNGIYLYKLTGGGNYPLIRYYRDHSNWVTSLGQSSDGRYLASSSADQTIKLWSLADANFPAALFPKAREWGAIFELQGEQVKITRLSKLGIAASRGLAVGDVIASIEYTNDQRVPLTTNDPQKILEVLSTNPVWRQVRLTVNNLQAVGRSVNIVPGWEPLETLFVDSHDQWALFTPQGYYHASDQGDALFGWHINRGAEVDPEFFAAEQFRHKLERPEILRNLLQVGNVPDVLALDGNPPANLQRLIPDLMEQSPQIVIVAPRHGEEFTDDRPPTVVARAMFPRSVNSADYRVKLFLNGIEQGEAVSKHEADGGFRYEWTPMLFEASNSVAVVAEPFERPADGVFAIQSLRFRAKPTVKTNRLHLLALAADEYPAGIDLKFSRSDAEALIERLSTASPFQPGIIKRLYNREANPPAVASAIHEIRQALGNGPSGDLVVLIICGHGISIDNQYYFIPPHDELATLDLQTAEGQALIKSVGISWQQLLPLASLSCRKVALLDTCHSGNAALEKEPLAQAKTSIRPFTRQRMLVMSATSPGGTAIEDPSLGHGIFTNFLLDGLKGEADDPQMPDRLVDVREVFQYVRDRVVKSTRGDRQQTPTSSPADLKYLLDVVPLVKF